MREAADKAAAKIKAANKKAADKIKKDLAKVDLTNKDILKPFLKKINKYNPTAFVPRGAALALFRLNFAGIARKLHPALLTHDELVAKHYDLANAEILRNLWNTKIKEAWEVIGGDMAPLKKAVLNGFDKAVFKTKKVKAAQKAERGESFDGNDCEMEKSKLSPLNKWANEFDLSDANVELPEETGFSNICEAACIAGLISAGGAVVVAVINSAAKKGGAKDNPYTSGSKEELAYSPEVVPDLSLSDTEKLKQIEKAALEDRRLHGLDSNTYESEMAEIESKYGTILGMSKPVFYVVAILTTLAVIGGGVLAYKHFKK